MPRTSRGRGAPLWLLWHRDGGHVPALSPLPSLQEQPPTVGWDGSAQPGPRQETAEHLCSNPRAGGRWGARRWPARAEESGQGRERRQGDSL